LFRDSVGGIWWKVCAVIAIGVWVLVGVGGLSWLPGAIAMSLITWQLGHSGIWAGNDDILIVNPVFGRRRVPWADIEGFTVAPFNQWMIAWVITRNGGRIPSPGISSGRKRTQRVDVVVEALNDLLRTHAPAHAGGDGAVPTA